VIDTPPHSDDKSFPSRVLSLAETRAELGCFFLSTQQRKEAHVPVEAAVKDDPKLALAHEDLGFLDLGEGKNDEAVREFSQAFELDNHMYRSLFAKTMLSPQSHAATADERALFYAALSKVVQINPQFAPAYVELAKFALADGKLTLGLAMARTAEKMEPSRAGYHLLTGQILLRMGHPAEAAAHAAYVASRWEGVDHDEAMELWNRVPPAQRSGEAPSDTPPGESLYAEGTVKSVSCDPHFVGLTLDHAGQALTFKVKGGAGGFSDTLWFGSDHFTPCFHVTGLRAVVRYKPGADKSSTGEVVSWGFRDDLPSAPNASAEASHTTESNVRKE
jgi:Tfp pilus assembly protein PilF